jgi:predicted nucleotidyltransferase
MVKYRWFVNKGVVKTFSSHLEKARRAYTRKLAASLAHAVARLREMPQVERVSVFGSYARGRRDLFTDLDILVVMRTEEHFPARTARIYQVLALPVDCDILCYTPEEMDSLRRKGFFKRIAREEIILYEKNRA